MYWLRKYNFQKINDCPMFYLIIDKEMMQALDFWESNATININGIAVKNAKEYLNIIKKYNIAVQNVSKSFFTIRGGVQISLRLINKRDYYIICTNDNDVYHAINGEYGKKENFFDYILRKKYSRE